MNLIDVLCSTAWAMEPGIFDRMVEILERHAAGIRLSDGEIEAAIGRAPGVPNPRGRQYEVHQGVALIPVQGVLSKYASDIGDLCYGRGNAAETIAGDIDTALADEDVSCFLLHVESPGGVVDGTFAVADRVRAAAAQKPCWAFIDGMGASAAYAIACGASQRSWESDHARRLRQAKWDREQAEREAHRRYRRWRTWVFGPTLLLGLAFAGVCGCEYTGLTHLGLISARAPWLEEPAPVAPPPVAYAAPKPTPRPVAVAPTVAPPPAPTQAPQPEAPEAPEVDPAEVAKAQAQVVKYTKAVAEATEAWDNKAAAVNDMLAYLYGSWADGAMTTHQHDGLIEKTQNYINTITQWETTLPRTPQALDADRVARTNIYNAQVEISNDLKTLDYDQGMLRDYGDRVQRMKDKLAAAQAALAVAQRGGQ